MQGGRLGARPGWAPPGCRAEGHSTGPTTAALTAGQVHQPPSPLTGFSRLVQGTDPASHGNHPATILHKPEWLSPLPSQDTQTSSSLTHSTR